MQPDSCLSDPPPPHPVLRAAFLGEAVLGLAAEEEGRMNAQGNNRFHAHGVALAWATALGAALAKLARKDPDLARQLRRAVASVPLNLAEGACRTGKDRMHHYRIAAGSAAEAMSALELALRWGHLGACDLEAAEALADRLRALLWRLTRAKG